MKRNIPSNGNAIEEPIWLDTIVPLLQFPTGLDELVLVLLPLKPSVSLPAVEGELKVSPPFPLVDIHALSGA